MPVLHDSRHSDQGASRTAASVPEGVRVYAIGDIHGRSDLLDRQHALIDADFAAGAAPVTHLVYLGDYVDRGPDSSGVLERLIQGPNDFVQVSMLRGNHEEMMLRFLEDPSTGQAWFRLGGLATAASYGIDAERVFKEGGASTLAERLREKIPQRHLALLAELKPFTAIGDYYFCHAGIRPGVPFEHQKEQDLLWIRNDFLDCTEDFGKVIVHGHSPVQQPDFHSNRINIDTGAYATGRLTCLVLEGRSHRTLST